MLEIVITTSVLLGVGIVIGLLFVVMQKPKISEADAENHPAEQTEEILAENTVEKKIPMQAVILCSGNFDENPAVYEYRGNRDCHAALAIGNGGRTCAQGCIGLGSCVKACPENAIVIRKGLAVLEKTDCTGCGECLDACPKNLIVLRPRDFSSARNCIRNCPGGICGACDSAEPAK